MALRAAGNNRFEGKLACERRPANSWGSSSFENFVIVSKDPSGSVWKTTISLKVSIEMGCADVKH